MPDCLDCGHSKDDHVFKDGTSVCTKERCWCPRYDEAYTNPDIDKYMSQIEKMVDRMQWVLINLKYFRNYNNQELVFAWWRDINHVDLTKTLLTKDNYYKMESAESITRAKRKWVELDKEKYGPFEPTVDEQKKYKQFAIEEFMVMSKL